MTKRHLTLAPTAGLAWPAIADDLPDPYLTRGDVLPVTAGQVCAPRYAKSVRHVSGKVKAEAFRRLPMPNLD